MIITLVVLLIIFPFILTLFIKPTTKPEAATASQDKPQPVVATIPTTTTNSTEKQVDAVVAAEPATESSDSYDMPRPTETDITASTTDFIQGQTRFSIKEITESFGYVVVNVDVNNYSFKERVLGDTGRVATKLFEQKFTEYPNATGVNVIYKCLKLSETSSCISYYVGKDTYKKVDWDKMFGDELCSFLRTEGAKTKDSKCIIVSSELR